MNLRFVKNEKVEMKGVKVGGEAFDFEFDVAPLPTSILLALRKAKSEDAMLDFVTPEALSKLVVGWKSTAFENPDTGEMLPCTPGNVLAVMEGAFDMYGVFTSAVLLAFSQAQRKNSLPSSDTTSITEPVSAEGAGQPSGQAAS